MTPELLKYEADNCDAQSGLSPAPLLGGKFKSQTMNAMAAPGGDPKKVDYPTPQEWYDYLNLEFGFTLDPCCAHSTAKCENHYTESDDGLNKPWTDERVFMNPPYGRNIGPWMEKAYNESKCGALVVCFVPARVDTNWWHDYAIRGEIRLPKGRCKNADGSAWPFPIAIVIFRPQRPHDQAMRHARELERELNIAKSTIESCDDMLKRIDGICDADGIPKDDGDEKGLRVQFCEGHRVKLLLEKYKRIAAQQNAPHEPRRE